jgi:hypothetical protein
MESKPKAVAITKERVEAAMGEMKTARTCWLVELRT